VSEEVTLKAVILEVSFRMDFWCSKIIHWIYCH